MNNSAIIYRGPSMLDGAPIVVVATGFAPKGSANRKTGADLIQTWILRDDVSPLEAVKTGADASICGDCPHRGTIVNGENVGRSCYVTLIYSPLNVWKTVQRGSYPTIEVGDLEAAFAGRGVRLGSYGDPAAVPLGIWEAILGKAAFWTGYTHQWRKAPELAAFCMASCDTAADRLAAGLLGFRTFRVRTLADAVERGEVICPASDEAGNKTTCDTCRACGGTGSKARADIVIAVHGTAGHVNNFNKRAA